MGISVIILAGGTGSRMVSGIPKVLHKLAGKTLLSHVIEVASALKPSRIFVVYGHMGEVVRACFETYPDLEWIEQKERLGTGHAVLQVLPHLQLGEQVLILYGDVPLISLHTLQHLVESTHKNQLGLLTATLENPAGLGRIVRDEYLQVDRIVEDRDASDIQRQIKEINTGIYCISVEQLTNWLPRLSNKNSQKEYYLTDVIHFAREEKISINVSKPRVLEEIYGVNTRAELAKLERIYQRWQAERLMASGVSLVDPSRIDVRGYVEPAQDCTVDVNVIFEGRVVLGEECRIGSHVVLKNVTLGRGVEIRSHSVVEGAIIDEGAIIGPFSRIRPNSHLKRYVRIGNFVEIKASSIGEGSKVSHLSYIGDTTMGRQVNIGAGTITCNFDGVEKYATHIEDDAFIGSDVQLIAPLSIGERATIGAGTTVTKNVKADTMVLNPKQQRHVENWKRSSRKPT